MKVALLKQVLDVFGPWSSVRWVDTDPRHLFDRWPGKAVLWEMTCLLKADWYIIPQQLETDYTYDAVLKHPGRAELITKYTTNVVVPTHIPFEEYDVVITFDPILDVPECSRTVFAYYVQEHWDRLYSQSLRKQIGNYDLFLAHMMDAEQELSSLPQAISFPYVRAPDIMCSTFQVDKEEAVWVDWRTLTTLGMTELWNEAAEAAAKRLEELIGFPVQYKGDFNQSSYGISDPPLWGDAARYLEAMARWKYYVAVGRSGGAGQGLCDAASLGCICIGEQDKVYHRMVCHHSCLCTDMVEMPMKIRKVISSPDLQEEVLQWQDQMLQDKFLTTSMALLKRAIEMKRKLSR